MPEVCVCWGVGVCVCVFSGNVLSFLFWSTGALDGGRGRTRGEEGRERGRRGGFSTWTYWSFTVLAEVFFFFSVFHLSGRCQGELSVLHGIYMHSVCTCVCVCLSLRSQLCSSVDSGPSAVLKPLSFHLFIHPQTFFISLLVLCANFLKEFRHIVLIKTDILQSVSCVCI